MTVKKLGTATALILLAACSDGGTGPTNRPSFTADAATYQPYEMATLHVNGAVPAVNVVLAGTMGASAIELMRSSDSTVSFLVPNVTGAQQVTFTVGATAYSGTVTVVAGTPAVADPQGFLEATADISAAQIDAKLAALAGQPMPGDSAVAVDMLEEARDSLASFRNRLAQLSPADAQIVANILNANLSGETRTAIAGVQAGTMTASAAAIPAACAQENTALKQYKCTWGEFFTLLNEATISLGAGALAAKSSILSGPVGLTLGAILGVQGILEAVDAIDVGIELLKIHGMVAWEIGATVLQATANFALVSVLDLDPLPGSGASARITGSTSAPLASMLATSNSSASMTQLTNGRAVTFSFAPKLRPVQAADRGAPVSWLSTGLRVVNGYNQLVARFKPDYQLKFRPPATSFPMTVPASEIAVVVMNNQKVKVERVTASNDRVTVKFTSTSQAVEKFTYDIVYTSGVYPPVRVRYEAELRPPTYIIAWPDRRELADTVTLFTHVYNYNLLLLNNDGSLISDPGDRGIWIDNNASTDNAEISMQYHHNSQMVMWAQMRDTSIYVDTTTATILLDDAPMRTMTFIAIDSVRIYRRTVPGIWEFNSGVYRERFEFRADGTIRPISVVHIESGAQQPVTTLPMTWFIEGGMTEEGKPTFELEWRINYPNGGGVAWSGFARYPARSLEMPGGYTMIKQ